VMLRARASAVWVPKWAMAVFVSMKTIMRQRKGPRQAG
jgi:hypothetical protein